MGHFRLFHLFHVFRLLAYFVYLVDFSKWQLKIDPPIG